MNLDYIINHGSIESREKCKWFGEKLIYLFVGRPAYKWSSEHESPFFHLPTIFIFDKIPNTIKRVYPFDTGAFKTARLPDYVTIIPLNLFELRGDIANIEKIISVFFLDKNRYFDGTKQSATNVRKKHLLTPSHVPAHALMHLYKENISEKIDDRARAIEVQIEGCLKIDPVNMIGLIVPKEYSRCAEYKKKLDKISHNIEYYDILPYNVQNYYSLIQSLTRKIYIKTGILDVD